jgi:hypothetical protein
MPRAVQSIAEVAPLLASFPRRGRYGDEKTKYLKSISKNFSQEDFMNKQTLKHFAVALAVLASFAIRIMAQSSPTQLQGSGWTAQSKEAPAVGSDGTNLYAAWKDTNSTDIHFSVNTNDSGWGADTIVSGTTPSGASWTAGTNGASSLAVQAEDNVWLAWRGASTNDIWISNWNGSSWSVQQNVQGTNIDGSTWIAGTSAAPAITYSGQLYIAWKGASGDNLWYSSFNGSSFAIQRVIKGSTWTAQSSVGPSFQDSGTLFWKGKSTDLWETPFTPPSWSSEYQVTCSDPNFTAETSNTPAATVLFVVNNTTNSFTNPVFWKGANSNSIWYTYSTDPPLPGCGWANQATVSGTDSSGPWSASTNHPPAVASATVQYGGYGIPLAILAWRDASTDNILYLDPTTLPGLAGAE